MQTDLFGGQAEYPTVPRKRVPFDSRVVLPDISMRDMWLPMALKDGSRYYGALMTDCWADDEIEREMWGTVKVVRVDHLPTLGVECDAQFSYRAVEGEYGILTMSAGETWLSKIALLLEQAHILPQNARGGIPEELEEFFASIRRAHTWEWHGAPPVMSLEKLAYYESVARAWYAMNPFTRGMLMLDADGGKEVQENWRPFRTRFDTLRHALEAAYVEVDEEWDGLDA